MNRRLGLRAYLVAWLLLLLTACAGGGVASGGHTVAMIPGYNGTGSTDSTAQAQGYPVDNSVINVTLSDTDQTHMAITLSQNYAPEGLVSFIVTNAGSMDHELVGFATKTLAADYKVTSFDGEANRVNEDTMGTNVVDSGAALKPGESAMFTVDLKSGHVALVCNLAGHYAAGMHADFWVTPKGATPVTTTLSDTDQTHMAITLSQNYAPEGLVSFIVTNAGSMDHELVGFATKTLAADYKVTSFDGEANRVNEDTMGTNVVDSGAALKPGESAMFTVDLKSGHVALVCNLAGHYAAGMHADFWVTPKGATPVTTTLSDTDQTHMAITLSQNYAPEGLVSFIVTNAGSMDHELVGFATKTLAADYKVTSFDGEANRVNEDTMGTNVVDSGAALKPGESAMFTVDLKSGHVALVCNLAGHYAAGMHADFWVTPKGATPVTTTLSDTDQTHMAITLSQNYAPEGLVSFIVTNAGSMDHELVGFATKTLAADYKVTSFDGEANRVNEDTMGTNVVDSGAALKPGESAMFTVDLKSGHVALVCNLAGHYAAGMHADFWVTPKGATPVTTTLSDTDQTHMAITLSQNYAPEGLVSFIVTNAGSMDHELVGFATKTLAADYKVTSFDGEANRVNEDTMGTNVVDSGAALKPGESAMFTVDLKSGHVALVCNLAGHYAAGMHADFWVTPPVV